MLVLDANLWVAAFDPADPFHTESVELFAEAARCGLELAGPLYVVLESVCALGRRTGNPDAARSAGAKMLAHPALHLEPLDEALVADATRIGLERRLRAADSLYAATAGRLDAVLLSWDNELVSRGGALTPSAYLAGARDRSESVSER